MLGTLVFLSKFNNYYNRELKRYDTSSEYSSYMVGTLPSVNFNPNDGITTIVEQLVASPSADYVLYTEDNIIVSRWFVLETKRMTSGLWQLTLRRDVLADNWEHITDTPMYVEKATVSDDNALIYNEEPFACNEVKFYEEELKDETGVAWLVGYVDKSYYNADEAFSFSAEVVADYTAASLSSWSKYYLLNTQWKVENNREFRFKVKPNSDHSAIVVITKDSVYYTDYKYDLSTSGVFASTNTSNMYLLTQAFKNVTNLYATLSSYYKLYMDDVSEYNTTNYNEAITLNNKVLTTSDKPSEYYLLSLTSGEDTSRYDITEDKATGYLLTYLQNIASSVSGWAIGTGKPYILVTATYQRVTTSLQQQGTYNVKIQQQRYTLKDAPYDMFVMPYGDVTLKNGSEFSVQCSKQTAMSIAQGIAKELGTYLYDVQLLPYCPATGFIVDEDSATIDINNSNSKRVTKVTDNSGNVRAALIWCTASSGSKYISNPYTIVNKKVSNCCYKFRLSSGSYSAAFDFSPAKNGGLQGYNVDFTYIPYNPYIRVAPQFGGLYGRDFKDARGLIDQGDHSITYLSDAWVQYQINNKNYLNAFNREIEHLDTQRKYERINQLVGSTVSAAAAGVTAGTVFGPVAGVAAGTASALGGVADTLISEQLYNENKSYAKDQFAYQLENIQALPNTLAKVVAYTPNNKVFPVLEVYKGTQQDIAAFVQMIRYQGMSVGVIATLSEYLGNEWTYNGVSDKGFVKGKPLQLKDIADDYHLAKEIAYELSQGIYTKE